MQIIQESLLRRDPKVLRNPKRWTTSCLTEVTACVEIVDGQLAIGKPDEKGRDKEVWENNPVNRYKPKWWY